jgi:CRP/FNR family transcriptional regulator
VVNCLSHFVSMVENLSFHKVSERVALALVEGTANDGTVVRRTQAELAAEVGTTREVVARCLADFQEAGMIRLGRGRITVLNRDQLLAVA